MATTVKDFIKLLSSYNQDAVITNEQLEDFIHIVSTQDGNVIISTKQPIGYCARSGGYVYPSVVNGYIGYSPELDEDLYGHEIEPLETYKLLVDGETHRTDDIEEAKGFVIDAENVITWKFNTKLRQIGRAHV